MPIYPSLRGYAVWLSLAVLVGLLSACSAPPSGGMKFEGEIPVENPRLIYRP